MTSKQLALSLPPLDRDLRETLVEGRSNAVARAALASWRDWPHAMMALVGPRDCGKSHLAAIWAHDVGARTFGADQTIADIAGEATSQPLVIEDMDRRALDEPALIALWDEARAGRAQPILFTARTSPDAWAVETPDLASRLAALAVVAVEAPDDEELREILLKLFADRGVVAPDDLVEYLILRMDRSHAEALRLTQALDARALTMKTRVTRRLALGFFAERDGARGRERRHGDEGQAEQDAPGGD